MIPSHEALVDYVERMRTLPDAPGRAHRIAWWREHAMGREAQAFTLSWLSTLAADIVMRLTCPCSMHQSKPLEVAGDTGQANAMVLRLLNASRAGDMTMKASLIRLVLDAHDGALGPDGGTFAVEVRDRLERLIITGQKRLGWSTW